MNEKEIINEISNFKLYDFNNLKQYIINNKNKHSLKSLLRIVELANPNREKNSAFYTNDFIVEKIIENLPVFSNKETISIIEPSVGAGNFLPFIFEKYSHIPKVNLFLVDVDKDILSILEIIYKDNIPDNFIIKLINQDFLQNFNEEINSLNKVDLIVGNPPFTKLNQKQLKHYSDLENNSKVSNLSALFLEKSIKIADSVSLIMPKNLLNTSEYSSTRKKISQFNIQNIIDFGEMGFKGVLIETINLLINRNNHSDTTTVISLPQKTILKQKSNYIFDEKLPYWVIYRNSFFDNIMNKLKFNVFDVFRDRQITNNNSRFNKKLENDIRILKSRNIDDKGDNIIDINNYDSYISQEELCNLSVHKFLDRDDVYLTPNMTYKPRVMKKDKGYIVNGSVAILIPKYNFKLTDKQRHYFSSDEFREFYKIARNYQTRSLNIDKNSVFWFGINDNIKQE